MDDIDDSFEKWFEGQAQEPDPSIEKFLEAASRGDTAAVLEFLDAGMDIDARGPVGNTALFEAVRRGHLDTIRLLLERGAGLEFMDSFCYTALTHALRFLHLPDPEPLKLLVAAGARFNLIDAFWTNNLDLARVRLEEGANPDHGKGSYFGPVLMEAARSGNVAFIDLLLDFGADIEAEDDLGNRPLLCASEYGQIEAVTRLLDRGADLDAANWGQHETALGHAASRGDHAMIELLLSRGARRGVADAAALNHPALLNVLIDEKLSEVEDVDHWVGDGCERISMIATARGNPEVVRLLLDRGATHLHWLDNHSLLAEAARHGHLEVIRLLIDRGASLEAVGRDGLTPLAWAIREGQEEAARLLRLAGASEPS